MHWLRGLFSQSGCNEFETAQKKTSAANSMLTGRLPSPGARIVLKTADNKELFLCRDDLVHIHSLQRMVEGTSPLINLNLLS